jgi:biopolymer transport protein ExbD
MSGHHRRKKGTEFVEPDLPITPMLDMSFQLLAFFIMTFKPTPTEGQIAMTLPPADQGGGSGIPSITDEQPKKYVIRVAATDGGGIGTITFREEGSPDETGENLGADPKAFMAKVKSLYDIEKKRIDASKAKGINIPPPKLTLELADKLLQAYVIQLFDASVQAGYTDISPVPIDKSKR